MLRLVPLIGAVYASSDVTYVITDDNNSASVKRVRVSFRGDDDETGSNDYRACGCDSISALSGPGVQDCSDAISPKGQNKDADPVGTGGMTSAYNSTTGIMTIKNRGGYGDSEAQTLALDGPGTLYTIHLDVEPRDDFLKITGNDGNEVVLTGNYSACLRNRQGLETAYMDKNLAPGTHYSESNNDYHTTEETQNEQDDLCHDVLTGKILMPAPVELDASATLTWSSDADDSSGANGPAHTSTNDFYEGFELIFVFNDVYTADVSTTQNHICVGTMTNAYLAYSGVIANAPDPIENLSITESAMVDNTDAVSSVPSHAGLPPSGAPSRVYFKDDDLNKLKVSGNIEIDADAGQTQTAYSITLEKFEPAGRWGYIMGQLANSDEFSSTERTRDDLAYGEYTVYGPRDTWGHNGAELPYYPQGGSTNTEAPRLIGGGPAGARVFNKHGDVIPGSARGMHPDYQAAEELIDVQSWSCDCTTTCYNAVTQSRCSAAIARTSGEPNGAGLQASQGSPPAPMYQLRVRSCVGVDGSGDATHCNARDSTVIQLIDIAEYEPKATFFGDLDPKTRVLQGEITVVTPAYAMGIRGYRAYATSNGNTNLALVWSDNTAREQVGTTWSDASVNGARSANPQFIEVLDKHCPPSSGNTDYGKYCSGGSSPNTDWCTLAEEPCGNDNPYSPKCLGKSCAHINVLSGSQGEWYISRYDNNGNAANPQTRLHGASETPGNNNLPQSYTSNTAQRNYSHNEYAQIYLPKSGWLTPIMMDVNTATLCTAGDTACVGASTAGSGDTLVLQSAPGVQQADLVTATLSEYIDMWQEESVIEWATDAYDTAHGWTLIYQPNYPEIEIPLGTPMAQGASGLRIVPVYHANPTLAPLSTAPSDLGTNDDGEEGESCGTCTCVGCAVEGSTNADAYVETYDWLVPNVTCTPTTMHCPLPTVWAHINYTTPSLYPEPAEGSCLQQKTGTSSLSGCSDKMNLDTRWYSANSPTTSKPGNSQQNTDEEDNGQQVAADTSSAANANWAGNCGDATSYFWFEKIACGSTRTFLTDRSLIQDFVQLTPTWEDIQAILDLYYTTKAPLTGRTSNVGFTFITADYHVAPVLPPKVNCTCESAMDAYASLLSVVSKTPTPGAPVTLDPEVLNTGTSKIVATLRMYQDPTYSIPASSVAAMPIVVTRFYLEVSTKFTRNRITISDCAASNMENLLNDTTSLKPRMNYCDNSTFDTKTERSPNGVTHMDRISMKKFKFQTTTDVFVQCKIRACAQQPCGICTGSGTAYRELADVDLAPVEGEMYAPSVSVRVAPNDMNALTFPDTVPNFRPTNVAGPTANMGQATAQEQRPATTKPIQISSNLVLSSVTASWAIQNREAVTETLRTTMGLTAQEELVITSISKLGRELSEKRQLQSGGVKIDFVIGVSDNARASIAQSKVTQLASGSPALAMQFSTALDQALMRRGQPAARLPANAMAFAAPTQSQNRAYSPQATQVYSNNGAHYNNMQQQNAAPAAAPQQPAEKSDNLILGLVLGAFAMGIMGVVMFMHFSKKAAASAEHHGEWQEESPDLYASKVAALDQNWQSHGAEQAEW